MGTIQSTIGLITGIPIQQTVDQLIAISARPRDMLAARTKAIEAEQVAISELTAQLLGVQFAAEKLGVSSTFDETKVSSSNSNLLIATKTGNPNVGEFLFTPVRRAQTHQLISSGVASLDDPLGEGELSFRFGGFVDRGVSLSELNGGQGVQRGKIRITDRSGASAVVDLTSVQTVDDVLEAINAADGVNVTAIAVGDSFKLLDNTGASTSNLKVQEVGAGSTAADLGLANIDVAAGEATGQDVLRLTADVELGRLNDGNGVDIRAGVFDLDITFRDNSAALQIEFLAQGNEETTLGDVIDTINQADPARLKAELSADGDRIVLTDLTTDAGGTFAVSSSLGGDVAEDLGLTGAAAGGVLTSRRLRSGLDTPLLSSLNGGKGLGALGQIDLTDRSGATDSIDLSAAETLDDVVEAINAANVAITARINKARNGIELADNSGQSVSHLIVANGDASNAADALGIAVDDAVSAVDSGALNLQLISRQTALSSLNHGEGVALGSFLITDTSGVLSAVNLKTIDAQTIGDVIDAVNSAGVGVQARINDAGDGIVLVDTAGGPGKIKVTDSQGGRAAADLRLAGESTQIDIGGELTEVIDGSTTFKLKIEAGDTLQDLIDRINELDAGVAATSFDDGVGTAPFRLSLLSQVSGSAGELLIDGGGLNLGFQEIAQAQDALLLVGSSTSAGAGVLASSSTNTFNNVLEGVSLSIAGESSESVKISVSRTDATLTTNVQAFVTQYNSLRDKLASLTFFNESNNTTGVLFGSNEALRVDAELSSILSSRLFGVGDIKSLEEVGISLRDNGKLEFDSAQLKAKFLADPEAVKQFFSKEQLGFASKIDALVEQFAGIDNSLLVNRIKSNQQKIDDNNDRVQFINSRLERERNLLLLQFYNMELAIGKLQSSLTAIESIQVLPPLFSAN